MKQTFASLKCRVNQTIISQNYSLTELKQIYLYINCTIKKNNQIWGGGGGLCLSSCLPPSLPLLSLSHLFSPHRSLMSPPLPKLQHTERSRQVPSNRPERSVLRVLTFHPWWTWGGDARGPQALRTRDQNTTPAGRAGLCGESWNAGNHKFGKKKEKKKKTRRNKQKLDMAAVRQWGGNTDRCECQTKGSDLWSMRGFFIDSLDVKWVNEILNITFESHTVLVKGWSYTSVS